MPYNIYSYFTSHVDGDVFKLIPKKDYEGVLDIISTSYPKEANREVIKQRMSQEARRIIGVNRIKLMCIERKKYVN